MNVLPYIIIILTTIACMYSAMKTRIHCKCSNSRSG